MLQLRNVSKHYPQAGQRNTVVQAVDLTIQPGELVVLTGKSGSGKSTLLGMLGLINPPSSGQIWWCGEDITQLHDRALAEIRKNDIGIIFQQFNLHPALSVLENVMYPLMLLKQADAKQKALAALDEVGMLSFAQRKPKQLSGGQMQRVSIARAFVKAPRLIIADEPTANLDSENSAVVYQLLQRLQQDKGVTVVIASHDAEFASSGVRAIRLHDGRIVADSAQNERAMACAVSPHPITSTNILGGSPRGAVGSPLLATARADIETTIG
jgi:ABC-type lipoprotein export system ATPase subunit